MDRAMTQQPQSSPRELCPHLAAAVLWMSKSNRQPKGGKRASSGRLYGGRMDDLLAL
jgi:hypothetical protein